MSNFPAHSLLALPIFKAEQKKFSRLCTFNDDIYVTFFLLGFYFMGKKCLSCKYKYILYNTPNGLLMKIWLREAVDYELTN